MQPDESVIEFLAFEENSKSDTIRILTGISSSELNT